MTPAAAVARVTRPREKKVELQIVLYYGKLEDDHYREPGIIPFTDGCVLLATDNVRMTPSFLDQEKYT